MEWRLLVHATPGGGAWNMALDHALTEACVTGRGALRLYAWDPPTVSFGRNEPTRGRYDLALARREGVGFVRRPTGGRAVLHHQEVTYCAVFHQEALGGLRAAYLQISRGIVEGLRRLGCPAEVAEAGAVLPPDAGPCFQAPAPGEVVLGGRKLVGSAQVRMGEAVLQHGSLILAGDQSGIDRLTGTPNVGVPPATVADVPGVKAEWEAVAMALAEGLELALGGRWSEGGVTPTERNRAQALEKDHYATEAWTWRR